MGCYFCKYKKKNAECSNYYLYEGVIISTNKNIYWVNEYINKGEYSCVYKCTDSENNIYALKVIDIRNGKVLSNTGKEYDKKEIYKEIKILKKCNHPHVINYVDSHEDRYHIYIITEFIEGTNLKNLINENDLEEHEILLIFICILKALISINSKNIMHLDIKPENIVIGIDQKIKLIGFGKAEYMHDNICKVKGTSGYMAPEVINYQYNNNPDIWSLGCLLYFMLEKELPYSNDDYISGFYRDLFHNDENISYNLRYIIKKMLSFNNRPSAKEIYNDNYICNNMYIYYNELNQNIINV